MCALRVASLCDQVGALCKVEGMLVTLTSDGQLAVNYLGTTPAIADPAHAVWRVGFAVQKCASAIPTPLAIQFRWSLSSAAECPPRFLFPGRSPPTRGIRGPSPRGVGGQSMAGGGPGVQPGAKPGEQGTGLRGDGRGAPAAAGPDPPGGERRCARGPADGPIAALEGDSFGAVLQSTSFPWC